MKRALIAALLLAACGHATPAEPLFKPSSRSEERAELVAKLKRDLVKVDRSIGVTEKLISASRSAPYQPDLVFRLAELYVEKSRYRFHLEAELHAEAGRGGSLVVPDVSLLKQKAVSLYERILREFPDFNEADKVRFFAAHEYRELGEFDRAMKTLLELVERHPKSPLVPEALLIVADYHFDKSQLDQAETWYLKVLDAPPSPAHDLARYKLGWVWINRGKHSEAVKYFEAAARSPAVGGASQKALSVKGLALSDLVYSYTESRPSKGAIEYFEALCDSANAFETVLEKLGNRYFIKQEYENAALAYRRLLAISRDFDRDPERAGRLYETIKASKGKVAPRSDDVKAMVRVAARARIDSNLDDKERGELLEDLEVQARDLATALHVDAQKKDEKALYSEAADAYAAYLELFRAEKQQLTMMRNRAEALFAAERFAEAGRQYEELAKRVEGDEREAPLYSALVAFQSALKDADKLGYFDRTNARYGIRQLGAFYVRSFPTNGHAAKVKFNIARACYDEGDLKEAGELFAAFAAEHPSDPDARAAAHLALDSFHTLGDYKALADTGAKLLAVAGLAPSLKEELKGILASARTEELSEAVIASDTGDKDTVQRLVAIAEEPSRAGSDMAEKALGTALGHAAARRDVKAVDELARKILDRFPKSATAANAVLTQARFAIELGDFDAAAGHYEAMHGSFGDDAKALEALDTAASLRLMTGETARAVADLEKIAAADKRAEAQAKLAEARLQARDFAGAIAAAQAALKADPGSARAAAVVGEALLEQGKAAEAEQALLAAGPALQRAAQADPENLGRVYFLWGESMYRQFEALGAEDIERKATMLQTLQQAYTSAAQLGGSWAIAGLYRMARSLAMLADSLEQVPEPPGLKERERTELKATLAKQARDLRNGSAEAFGACVKKAHELEVYSPFAQGCLTRSAVDPKPAAVAPSAPPSRESVGKYRDALLNNPADAAALEGLGRALLAAGDLRRARLAFGRAVEVDGNRGSAHAALGFTLARLGETDDAVVSLKKALEIDGRDDKARANLAALKCRYGDPDGAREELKRLKSSPSGPDLDPEYAACRR